MIQGFWIFLLLKFFKRVTNNHYIQFGWVLLYIWIVICKFDVPYTFDVPRWFCGTLSVLTLSAFFSLQKGKFALIFITYNIYYLYNPNKRISVIWTRLATYILFKITIKSKFTRRVTTIVSITTKSFLEGGGDICLGLVEEFMMSYLLYDDFSPCQSFITKEINQSKTFRYRTRMAKRPIGNRNFRVTVARHALLSRNVNAHLQVTQDVPTEKSFQNLIKSTRNQIVFTIHRLIWNQTDVSLAPNQSENGKYNLISVWSIKIWKIFLCVYTQQYTYNLVLQYYIGAHKLIYGNK